MPLVNHGAITSHGVSGYFLAYVNDKDFHEPKAVDELLLLDNGLLYRAEFIVTDSLFAQYKGIRDSMLSSITVGDSYDTMLVL